MEELIKTFVFPVELYFMRDIVYKLIYYNRFFFFYCRVKISSDSVILAHSSTTIIYTRVIRDL